MQAASANDSTGSLSRRMLCRTGCPALGVCLSADSWCDDHVDCPDASDEVS